MERQRMAGTALLDLRRHDPDVAAEAAHDLVQGLAAPRAGVAGGGGGGLGALGRRRRGSSAAGCPACRGRVAHWTPADWWTGGPADSPRSCSCGPPPVGRGSSLATRFVREIASVAL